MVTHDGHRQRMRQQLKTSGMDSMSDVQVLEVLLYYVISRQDTNPIAHALLERFGTLSGVLEASREELLKVEGVGERAAELICLIMQLERRHLIDRVSPESMLDSTEKCGRYLTPYFHNETEEVVYLLCLDAKCKKLDCVMVHRGDVNTAGVSIRKVVKTALASNASSVVLAHNHPSGIALPSREDIETTMQVKQALATVNIILADHIIVAEDDFVSMADDGLLRGDPNGL